MMNLFGDIHVYNDISKITEKPNAIIDFSIPSATFEMLEYAKANNIPIVIATTGFTKEQEESIKEYGKYIPVFRSSNMSFDINLMCKLVAQIAPLFKDCDIEITETHHRNKVDSPSGTALMLADSINKALDR